jgi:DNA sulfur modification protein DndC
MGFKEKVAIAKAEIERMYLDESDGRDWAVAWSGGKDSTCVMGLVVSVLESIPPEKRTRKVHAVMSDTVVENPNLEAYMHDQVDKLRRYAVQKELPIEVHLVKRPPEQSYFYLILGRGYFLPMNNGQGRWCTDRLKIQPQNKILAEIKPSYILLGSRLAESENRKRSIEKWTEENDPISRKIGAHPYLPDTKTFMPIVDFTVEDVWAYLQFERLGWSSTHAVRKLYKEATGECGFSNPRGTKNAVEACGARFGCWTCPVILNDRSTEKMSEYNAWMRPLSEWRMLQIKVFGDYKPPREPGQSRKERSEVLRKWEAINAQIKRITKSGYNRNGKRMTDKQGNPRDDYGTITVEAREYLFEKLIETEAKVNELRAAQNLPPLQLISNEEKRMIREQWEIDRKHYPHLVTNVNKIPISELDRILKEAND